MRIYMKLFIKYNMLLNVLFFSEKSQIRKFNLVI